MIFSKKETEGYKLLKSNALAFVKAMKFGREPGAYKKEASETEPSTYGSYHATQVLNLFGELRKMPKGDLDAWAERIKKLQVGENGFFSNRAQDVGVRRHLREMDPVWHFTRGMIWCLRTLGPEYTADKPLDFVEPFLNKKTLYDYIKSYDWKNSWAAGNQILALVTAMQAARDWQGASNVDQLLEEAVFPALEELVDKETGYWGTQLGADAYNGMFGTIHILPIYFAQGWEYKDVDRSVDTTLACQLADGSFWPGGSDCPDFDGAYMLYNLSRLTTYRSEDVEACARKYILHAEQHIADDGVGFLLHRKDSTPDMWKSRPHFIWKEGDLNSTEEYRDEDPTRDKIMLGSWFYPLSLALISGMLSDTGYDGPYRLERLSLHQCNVDEEPSF